MLSPSLQLMFCCREETSCLRSFSLIFFIRCEKQVTSEHHDRSRRKANLWSSSLNYSKSLQSSSLLCANAGNILLPTLSKRSKANNCIFESIELGFLISTFRSENGRSWSGLISPKHKRLKISNGV